MAFLRGEQIPEDMRDKVIAAVSPNLDTHLVLRDDDGEVWTQCMRMVVDSSGYVRQNWRASWPGHPEGTSHGCMPCKRAM